MPFDKKAFMLTNQLFLAVFRRKNVHLDRAQVTHRKKVGLLKSLKNVSKFFFQRPDQTYGSFLWKAEVLVDGEKKTHP